MKRALFIFATALLILCGCGEEFSSTHEIHVITREEGSGTRTSFCDAFGLMHGEADTVSVYAAVTNSNAVVMNIAANDCHAIGYISLGTLDTSVKALAVDGVYPTTEAVANGSYPAVRRFSLVCRSDNSAAQEFIEYIFSDEGRRIISCCGYAPIAGTISQDNGAVGDISVCGSSSVYPLMERLGAGWLSRFPQARFELQQSDSSTGISAVCGGICDIGMISRPLAVEELSAGLSVYDIALDGIAVIVARDNPTFTLSSEQIRRIYSGEATAWNEI